jgi:Flp pilus assembly protein TadG
MHELLRVAAQKRRSRLQRGQSLVELAISSVVLLMLLSGAFDFGQAYFSFVLLNNAVSEGARWAAAYSLCAQTANDQTATGGAANCQGSNSVVERVINEDETLDQTRFIKVCATELDASSTVNYWTENTNNNIVTLSVTYNIQFITPVISGLFGSSIPVTSSVQEVIRGNGAPLYTPAVAFIASSPVMSPCP